MLCWQAASQMLRQLKFAMGDLALHDAKFNPQTDSPFAQLEAVGERTSILRALPEDRFLCSFSSSAAASSLNLHGLSCSE